MTKRKGWLEVDRRGLAAIASRRKAHVLTELFQNAWDEETTEVHASIKEVPGRPLVEVEVIDDSPDGFRDLAHAWTLYAPSDKAGDPSKRGRFNRGEKLVLALAEKAEIISTKGGVRFDDSGRHLLRARTSEGSVVRATIRMTRSELVEAMAVLRMMIPPVKTIINGERLRRRPESASIEVVLPTEIVNDEGVLRRTTRKARVAIYSPSGDRSAYIFEMGIPVVEHDGVFDVDVHQKVPLNSDRDNVTPAYLRRLRTVMLDLGSHLLTPDEVKQPWVRDAVPQATPEAVRKVMRTRFGANAVTADPSNPEATKRAFDEGREVVHGGSMSSDEWAAARRALVNSPTLKPAGRVIETGVPTSADGIPPIPEAEWTQAMVRLRNYAAWLARHVGVLGLSVEFTRVRNGSSAWYGGRTLTFNLQVLGRHWAEDPNQERVDALLIHELAHEKVADHLSRAMNDECCRIGARLRTFDGRLVKEDS